MNEILYIYVKGSGWVAKAPDVYELADGLVTFEYRKPNVGEKFLHRTDKEQLDEYLLMVKNNPGYYQIQYYQSWRENWYKPHYDHYLTLVRL